MHSGLKIAKTLPFPPAAAPERLAAHHHFPGIRKMAGS
jgi:hypothetical protein